MLTVEGGTKPPSGRGLPHCDRVGATAHGMPNPTPSSDLPPSAACGTLAPSVTSVPAGSGQAVTPVGHGKAVLPGPRRGIVEPPTISGVLVAGLSTTGGSVEARGMRSGLGVPMKTPLRPVAFNEAATALYLAVKAASGVAVTPSSRKPAPPAVRMSLPMIPSVTKSGFKARAWLNCEPFPRRIRSAIPPFCVSETSAILKPGTERLS